MDPDITVIRNDEKTCEEIEAMKPDRIIISPGPGRPEQAGICVEAVRYFEGKVPILGVCLGHQSICQAYGATITYAKELMHGKQSVLKVDTKSKLFKGFDKNVKAARYHSLAADEKTMPECLRVTARTEDGEIMAVEHTDYEIYGLQFHPESVLTPEGKRMLANFIDV
jgi:anthranilate synthase component 2